MAFGRAAATWLTLAVWLAGCRGLPGNLPLTPVRTQTLSGVGAAQGLTLHNGLLYVYGDADTGIIREYRLEASPYPLLRPTGRSVRLTAEGRDVAPHPTGLTFHPRYGCFLGDTVRRRGRILHIDFDKALQTGTLEGAVLNVVDDDAAVNGTRPEFVFFRGRWLLATSDYGPGPNFVRFYDPARLRTAQRTSDVGVELHRVPCGPWVQTLHFRRTTGQLVLVQNQIEGLRWRLTVIDDLAHPDYRMAGRVIDFDHPTDELEGFVDIGGRLGVFVSAMPRDNAVISIAGPRRATPPSSDAAIRPATRPAAPSDRGAADVRPVQPNASP